MEDGNSLNSPTKHNLPITRELPLIIPLKPLARISDVATHQSSHQIGHYSSMSESSPCPGDSCPSLSKPGKSEGETRWHCRSLTDNMWQLFQNLPDTPNMDFVKR